MYPWRECLLVIRSIHVPLLDSVAGGDMVDEFCIPNHVTKKDKTFDDSMKTDFYKTSKVTTSNWSRFLVVSSTVEGALNKLSPFAIQKAIVGLSGEPKSVK